MQDCCNSIANALRLLQSCAKPSIYWRLINQWSIVVFSAQKCYLQDMNNIETVLESVVHLLWLIIRAWYWPVIHTIWIMPSWRVIIHMIWIDKYPQLLLDVGCIHDDTIKWKHFPHYWPFVRRIYQSLVWIPLTKTSDMVLWCFLWSVPEQTIRALVIRDAVMLIMMSL